MVLPLFLLNVTVMVFDVELNCCTMNAEQIYCAFGTNPVNVYITVYAFAEQLFDPGVDAITSPSPRFVLASVTLSAPVPPRNIKVPNDSVAVAQSDIVRHVALLIRAGTPADRRVLCN